MSKNKLLSHEFLPGQRWVSNTEPELGLGIVVDTENRRVTLSFPAAAEQRVYASNNAPLSRVLFQAGDDIRLSDGSTHTVIEFTEISGRRFYRAENSAGAVGEFDELDLDSFMRFSKPQDRLLAGQIDKLSKFALRVETLNNQFRVRQSVVHGLAGPRVQLLPHQLYIAQQVSERFAPRVLLADEVGLGKTIEAGLVVHRQLLTGRASRVLILVPDSLAFQWLVEMRRRFNLRFSLIDSADIFSGTEGVGDAEGEENELDADEISPENPFDQSQLFICPISRLTANDALAQFCLASDWDLLLVDEAHHLTWTPESASPAYTLVEKLAARARGVLLLTATPEQLGVAGHFARLRLLDPDRYYDLQAFIDEETDYAEIGDLVLSLSDLRDSGAGHLPDSMQARLIELLGNEKTADLLESLSTSGVDADQGSRRDSAIRDAQDALLDRHGTGRVLFRNTRSNVGGFPKRELVTHPLIQPAFFEQKSSGASVEQLLHPESLMSGDSWLRDDPRVGWLVNLLKQKRTDKFLLICARAETAIALENYLRLRQGTQSAVFHEGMDLVARDRAAAYFADTELGAQLLVCSEIGSEGRNFQFSHNLICFDLPLNPDLLEQRIGRLDRIGQTETVRIHVPFYEHSAQHRLMSWYHRGMNAFESVCPVGANVSALHGEALVECLKDDPGDRFDRLLEETASYTGDLLNQLHDGRDRLLEMNSCRPDKAAAIIEDVIENARPLEFTDYIERLFDGFGLEVEPHSADTVVVRPGEEMAVTDFPGLPHEGLTGTISRTRALSREDMDFLSWEHPLVAGAMDMLLSSEGGNTALGTIKLPPIKAGTLLIEAIYTLSCAAPKSTQLERYLESPITRVLIDEQGNNLGKALPYEKFSTIVKGVAPAARQQVVKHLRQRVEATIKKSDAVADNIRAELVARAINHMTHELDQEQQRLAELAKLNPAIRQQEVAHIGDIRDDLEDYLGQATMRLDAVRVVIAS